MLTGRTPFCYKNAVLPIEAVVEVIVMARPLEVRLAAMAGWIAFVGVVGLLIVIPTMLAGQPPTVSSRPSDVIAYFRHPELAIIYGGLGSFVGILAIIAFGYGLRTVLVAGGGERAKVFADLGLALLVVTLPIYVVSSALGAMLVQAADGDPATFASLFRFYDLLYDGAADILEGAWIGAFSLAGLGGALPRWLAWLGIGVTATRWIKAFVPVAAVPEAVIPVSGVIFLAWFLAIVVWMTRQARRSPAGSPNPALAGA